MAWYTCDHIKSHEGTSLATNDSRIPEAWKFEAKIFQASLAVEEVFVNESFPPNPCQSDRAQHVTRLHVCDMFSVPPNPSHRPTQAL